MSTKVKWTCAAFILGFAVAWIAQEFRIGHMQNQELARQVQPIYEAHMKLLDGKDGK